MALAFAVATFVEVVQRYALPTRSGEARDVVANSFGALVGGVLGWLSIRAWAWLVERREAQANGAIEMLRPPLGGPGDRPQ